MDLSTARNNVENLSTAIVENFCIIICYPLLKPIYRRTSSITSDTGNTSIKFQTHFCTFFISCPQFCPIYPRFEQAGTFIDPGAPCYLSSSYLRPPRVMWMMWKTYPPRLWISGWLTGCYVDDVENSSTLIVDKWLIG